MSRKKLIITIVVTLAICLTIVAITLTMYNYKLKVVARGDVIQCLEANYHHSEAISYFWIDTTVYYNGQEKYFSNWDTLVLLLTK